MLHENPCAEVHLQHQTKKKEKLVNQIYNFTLLQNIITFILKKNTIRSIASNKAFFMFIILFRKSYIYEILFVIL